MNCLLIFGCITFPPPPPPDDKSVTALTCDIEIPANFDGTVNHWIPNTGDKLDSLAIKLTAIDSESKIVPLTKTLANIVFLPPVDQNWITIDADSANIHRNMGTCIFVLFAHTPGNTDYQEVARFQKNGNASNEDTSIKTILDNSGPNSGLRVDADGYLYYFVGAKQYTRFAVSIDTSVAGTIKPGDDMKLRFALADR
jgi:hypothetical protein